MKILLVHNDYGKYSGEEAVVDKMAALFASLGHDVAQLRMSTAGVRDSLSGKVRGFVEGVYSRNGVRAMREALERERPDVVNVHNLYPFIGPAALQECRRAGVPVIMTVHNFRLVCPTGLFMRDGVPCELCLERGNEWGCVRHNCEHSLLKSAGYALRNAAARWRGDYRECVTRFACITDFQRRKLMEAGFEAGKLTVIPNSVDALEALGEVSAGSYVGYCGRVSYEKGGDLFVELARRNPGIRFRVAGEVRDVSLVDNLPDNIELLGYVSGRGLAEFYRDARFIVMPSRCYEGFPMAILEAASHGKPVIGPDHGGFTEIIGRGDDASGVLVTPGDVDAFSRAVAELWDAPEECLHFGEVAFAKLRERYASGPVAEQWQKLLAQLAPVEFRIC